MGFFSKLFGGSAKVSFVRTNRQADGNRYDIYRASSREQALAFLREHEVKEERRYAIVETPQGNLGKDFILIFDERTQATIELAARNRLPQPKKSKTHCCCCGYPVIPFKKSPSYGANVGSITEFVILSTMKSEGTGWMCKACHALCCAVCGVPEDAPACVFCRKKMTVFQE